MINIYHQPTLRRCSIHCSLYEKKQTFLRILHQVYNMEILLGGGLTLRLYCGLNICQVHNLISHYLKTNLSPVVPWMTLIQLVNVTLRNMYVWGEGERARAREKFVSPSIFQCGSIHQSLINLLSILCLKETVSAPSSSHLLPKVPQFDLELLTQFLMSARIVSGLNLPWSCACYYHCCDFI